MQQLKKRTHKAHILTLVTSALILLSSCGSNRRGVSALETSTSSNEASLTDVSINEQANAQKENQARFFKLCEAKWPDMPLIFATERVDAYAEESNDGRSCVFKITTGKKHEQLCAFYKQEMERAGWQSCAIGIFPSYSLFVYDKPYKIAYVKIVSQENDATCVECLVLLKDISKLQEIY